MATVSNSTRQLRESFDTSGLSAITADLARELTPTGLDTNVDIARFKNKLRIESEALFRNRKSEFNQFLFKDSSSLQDAILKSIDALDVSNPDDINKSDFNKGLTASFQSELTKSIGQFENNFEAAAKQGVSSRLDIASLSKITDSEKLGTALSSDLRRVFQEAGLSYVTKGQKFSRDARFDVNAETDFFNQLKADFDTLSSSVDKTPISKGIAKLASDIGSDLNFGQTDFSNTLLELTGQVGQKETDIQSNLFKSVETRTPLQGVSSIDLTAFENLSNPTQVRSVFASEVSKLISGAGFTDDFRGKSFSRNPHFEKNAEKQLLNSLITDIGKRKTNLNTFGP